MSIGLLVTLAVTVVLVTILVLRMHAFLSLLSAALLVAVLSSGERLQSFVDVRIEKSEMSKSAGEALLAQSAASRVSDAFGETAGSIGIVIALASVIGGLLMHSGAAARIVDAMLKVTGTRLAPEALAAGSFVLGIPVFFDTVFYLMIPLARSLRQRVGKDYVLFILSILAGGSITHSLVPPTPGPLQVAATLKIDIGVMLIAGLVIGGITSVISLAAARLINRTIDLPLRDIDLSPENEDSSTPSISSKPPLFLALLPIGLPVILIAGGSIVEALQWSGPVLNSLLHLSDKNVSLAIGCVAACGLLPWIASDLRRGVVSSAIASSGGIILITSAGGSLGKMLYQAGIAEAIGSIATAFPGMMLLPLAFFVTAAIRTVQGSATIAMITSASILQGLAISGELPFHPVYLAMAIGAGSKPVSWMTDSAFWVISEMTGMTEREALRIISPMSIAMGVSALFVTMIAAFVYPAI